MKNIIENIDILTEAYHCSNPVFRQESLHQRSKDTTLSPTFSHNLSKSVFKFTSDSSTDRTFRSSDTGKFKTSDTDMVKSPKPKKSGDRDCPPYVSAPRFLATLIYFLKTKSSASESDNPNFLAPF